ncbi:MAG: hypothetical protein KAS72_11420 [Phycisphaerales bacterium]|nr:hypothetical protein [Phycisphaerales bacterium]
MNTRPAGPYIVPPIRSIRLILLAAALCAASACQSHTPDPRHPVASPAVRQALPAAVGLELRWWIVDDEAQRLAEVLSEYSRVGTLLPEATTDRLARNGFRLTCVPVDHFTSLRSALNVSTELSCDWLGQSPEWLLAMSGPWLREGQSVRLDIGERSLPEGRFEFMVRAWAVAAGREPCLYVEWMPRFIARRQRSWVEDRSASRRTWMARDALARVRLEQGFVYLLTAKSPTIDWEPAPPPATDTDEVTEDVQPLDELELFGPPAQVVPTIAELLLKSPRTVWSPRVGRRAMVVLIPHLPAELSMLPPVPDTTQP